MEPVKKASPLAGGNEANHTSRQMIDQLIDELGAQSFPASDPPAWGSVSSRFDQVRRDAGPG
jgi:hypothetical protein